MPERTRERRQLIRTSATVSRRRIVEHLESYLLAHMDTPLPMATLCHIAGLKERALRNAFYDVRGMSPTQWLFAARLQSVRRALSDARQRTATVTRIATDHGFYELGRFAATYKHAFGEAPSVTLRARQSPIDTAQNRRQQEVSDGCTRENGHGNRFFRRLRVGAGDSGGPPAA